MKKLLALLCAMSMLFAALLLLPACKKEAKPADETTTAAASGDGETLPEATTAAGETQTASAGETTAPQPAAETSAVPAGTEASSAASVTQAPAATAAPATSAPSSAAPAGDALALTMLAAKTGDLKKGDTFDVTVGIRNAKWLASVTVNLNYDHTVFSVERTKTATIPDFDSLAKDYGNFVKYAGYTMNTVDIAENTLFTVTFRVNSVPSDRAAVLDLTVQQIDLGTDASGASVRNVKNEVAQPSVQLAFAG